MPSIPKDAKTVYQPVVTDGTIVKPEAEDPCKRSEIDPCQRQTGEIVRQNGDKLDKLDDKINNLATNPAAAAGLAAALLATPVAVKKFVKCNDGNPEFTTELITVPAFLIPATIKQFERLADIEGKFCERVDPVVAMPDHHYYRSGGDVPQLVYIYRQKLDNGIDSKNYLLTIPYPTATAINNPPKLPDYIKGNYEGIYRLSNNFPVIINAKDRNEVIKVWDFIKPLIEPQYTSKFIKKIAEREGQIIFVERDCTVWAADYFAKGQQFPRTKRKSF